MSQIPNTIEKRNILFGTTKLTPEAFAKYAKNFEEQGWLSDAADFWHRAGSKGEMERMLKAAAAEGDAFLVIKLLRFLGDPKELHSELKTCAEKAELLGKTRYAIKAYERLGLSSEVERVRESIKADGDIVSEEESKVFIPQVEEEDV